MEDKILDPMKPMTLKQVIDKINKIVGKKFEIVENSDDIQKWTNLPILLLESEEVQSHILKFIEFIDGLFISKDEKISYIITLSCLIKFGKLDITKLEDGSLFVLADYFNEKEINAIEKELPIVGNNTILNAVRTKTLENLTRVEMLEYAYKLSQVNKVKSNQIDEFAKEFASHIEKLDYYEILKLIEK